ncbi:hypothetical protein [Kineococcus sp. SYSU DK006]|uniref:hypothetical protein n=1 Tax=Kineococcus sp. SYSU DK006 TaxID=3383127 RepID=UPI003D7DE86C
MTPRTAAPRASTTLLPWAVLVASALPVALLLADLALVLGGSFDEFSPWAAQDGGTGEGLLLTRVRVALSTVDTVPTLLVATVGCALLGAASVAGGRLAPGRTVRVAGAVVAALVALVAAAAALGTALGLGWSGYLQTGGGRFLELAPVLGPMLFVAVVAATGCAVLARGPQR